MGIGIALSASPVPATTRTAVPVKRDWHAFPAVAEIQTDADIYAIGDMHGDFEKAAKLLVAAGLIAGIPANPKAVVWSGGKSVFVCTGDMIDKWTQGVEVLQMMRALQASAQKSGGRVVVTLGNHEAEFLASHGDEKKAADFSQELLAMRIDPADVAAGKDADGLGAWLQNRPIAAKVNDWFFCHAGNTFGVSLKELESSIEKGVDKDGFGTFVLAEPNSILEARMGPVPWWMMALTTQAATQNAAETEPAESSGACILKKYIAALGCKHLAVGHQPGNVSFGGGIERKAGEPFAYDGILFLMDVGMSRGVQDSRGIILKIQHGVKGHVSAVDDAGNERLLWSEQ